MKFMALLALSLSAATPPAAIIANDQVEVKLYLPDKGNGFYKGTRFDWSGIISSLQYGGHNYYGPWFTQTAPAIHDFIYQGADIIAGPCSAITGPVNEFKPVGFEEAKAGSNFVKIGVGALRKPDDRPYDNYHVYEIADPGTWQIKQEPAAVEFTQTLADSSSGFGYVYRKVVGLTPGKAELVLRHSLRNTGTRAIQTSVYNHNFLVLDQSAPGPGVTITVPFRIQSANPPEKNLAAIRNNQIEYLTTLKGEDKVATALEGFGTKAEDNRFSIENSAVGAGMSASTDRPLVREALWSIRSVIAVEPFISVEVQPGAEFSWTTTYVYYKLSGSRR